MAFDPNAGDSGPTNQSGGNSDLMKQIAAALAAAGGGLAGRALSGGGNGSGQMVPPQLMQLLDNSVARQGYQNPLFQAATKGSYDMLPGFAKEGSQLSGSLPSTLPPAAPFGGGGGGGVAGAAAGGLGAGALAAILAGLKKLFSGGGNPGRPAPGPGGTTGSDGSPLPSSDPFDSNNGWDGFPTGGNGYDPMPNVDTDQFLGSWPETGSPFDPFDPGMLGPGSDEPLPPSGWSKP